MSQDDGEVALLRLACSAADAALTDLLTQGRLRPGRTEKEVRRDLEALMLDHGADAASFETIVATGTNSAIPHHRPTDAVLASGDFVKIDFGALVCGYHSDMTRTFVLDKAADWQREIYELVATSQRAGREALAPASTSRPSTPHRGRSSWMRATATRSLTGWDTGSGCRSTKRRESTPPPPVHFLLVLR